MGVGKGTGIGIGSGVIVFELLSEGTIFGLMG